MLTSTKSPHCLLHLFQKHKVCRLARKMNKTDVLCNKSSKDTEVKVDCERLLSPKKEVCQPPKNQRTLKAFIAATLLSVLEPKEGKSFIFAFKQQNWPPFTKLNQSATATMSSAREKAFLRSERLRNRYHICCIGWPNQQQSSVAVLTAKCFCLVLEYSRH